MKWLILISVCFGFVLILGIIRIIIIYFGNDYPGIKDVQP